MTGDESSDRESTAKAETAQHVIALLGFQAYRIADTEDVPYVACQGALHMLGSAAVCIRRQLQRRVPVPLFPWPITTPTWPSSCCRSDCCRLAELNSSSAASSMRSAAATSASASSWSARWRALAAAAASCSAAAARASCGRQAQASAHHKLCWLEEGDQHGSAIDSRKWARTHLLGSQVNKDTGGRGAPTYV